MLKRLLAAAAATALLLSVAALPALAEGKGKAGGHILEQFQDMVGFDWAATFVGRAAASGHMKGRALGQFAPGQPITRQEAAVAVVRLMHQEAAAGALNQAAINALLRYSDANEIASWADEHVAILVQRGILTGQGEFNPKKNATRLWVTVLLVKALGFEAEAVAKMNATLPFKDSQEIPAQLVGYVAAAVDHKLVSGYDDRTFKANRDVRRVEMAKLLGVADILAGISGSKKKDVKGTIRLVAGNQVTLEREGASLQVTVAANAAVFVDGLPADLAGLKTGMKARFRLDAGGQAVFVEAKTPDDKDDDEDEQEFQATVMAVNNPGGGALATLLLKLAGNSLQPYPVAANASLTARSGATVTIGSIQANAVVQVKIENGVITRLKLEDGAPAQPGKIEFKGTVTATDNLGGGKLGINGAEYTLAAGLQLQVKNTLVALSTLKVGDKVEARVEGGVITRLKLDD